MISLHILAILYRAIGDAFGSGELAFHHDRLGILVIGDGFGLIFQSLSPGVESFIGSFAGYSFIFISLLQCLKSINNCRIQLRKIGCCLIQGLICIHNFRIQPCIFFLTGCCFGINGISISLDLLIQADQIIPYRIVLFDISSVFGSLIGHSVRSHFTCYSHITRRSDTTGINASGSQLPIDFHIFDDLIFFGPYNQIAILGNMQGCAGLLVRHSLLDLSIGGFTGCNFIFVSRSQSCNPFGRIFIDLLDHLILLCIGTKARSRFLCQGGVQFSHVIADGVGRFYDGPILNCSVCLAYIVLVGFTQHVLFYIGNTSIKLRNSIRIGFNLCIQAAQVFPYRIVLFDISSVFGSLVGHTVRSHFTCYSYITRRSDTTGINASGSQFSTDFHIFDCLIFFSAYN